MSRSKRKARLGATTVEFAIVLPVILIFMYGLLEVSMAYRTVAGIRTAFVQAGREASILTASNQSIQTKMTESLARCGVNQPEIQISPQNIDSSTIEIEIFLRVAPVEDNGFAIRKLFTNPIERRATFKRIL
ncbi:MAG: TadE family protein [Planctomycetota bacterium]